MPKNSEYDLSYQISIVIHLNVYADIVINLLIFGCLLNNYFCLKKDASIILVLTKNW